jgi:hypothetical protein
MLSISVARDFTDTPGPRSREEGENSGEQFLDEVLLPRFQEALRSNQKLMIDLDETEGYATSFLEAAFGGLTRKYDSGRVLGTLEFKSDAEPYLIQEILKYIKEAAKK